MPDIVCSAPDCGYSFGAATGNALNTLIELHARTAHPPEVPPQPTSNMKAEKFKRPTISPQGTTEEFNYFKSRWHEYKSATKMEGRDIVFQLLESCEETLRKDLTRCYGSLIEETEENVLKCIFLQTFFALFQTIL